MMNDDLYATLNLPRTRIHAPSQARPNPSASVIYLARDDAFEVKVQSDRIDQDLEVSALARIRGDREIAHLLALVSARSPRHRLAAVEIEHYPGMTEQALWSAAEEATSRYGLDSVRIVHRTGRVAVGEIVAYVAALALVRQDAVAACQSIGAFLQSHGPFWKKEIAADGTAQWIDPSPANVQTMRPWI